jgi:osmotically-inducible protein OsmY
MADVLASSVEGVTEVVNNLIPGPELERRIASALAADSRTRNWPIRVHCDLGYVQLQGYVPDEEVAQAAIEIARQTDGVKHVTSSLQVRRPLSVAA